MPPFLNREPLEILMNFAVTVTATYLGTVEIEAETAEEATRLAEDQVRAGLLSPDLTFSGYTEFEDAEEWPES
jgi:hypothetical protein